MRQSGIAIVLLFVLMSTQLLGQASEQRLTAKQAVSMDYFATVSTLILYDDFTDPKRRIAFEETWEEVKRLLEEIENQVSLSVFDSDLSVFNALEPGQRMSIREHTANITAISKEMWEESQGLYDPSVFPLVDLWGFSPRFHGHSWKPTQPYDRDFKDGKTPPPDEANIQSLKALVDFGRIKLSSQGQKHYLTKEMPNIVINGTAIKAQIDYGGIAKGYAADRVIDLLRSKGYQYGYFICGDSSISVMRHPENGGFELGIGSPRGGHKPFMYTSFESAALSSSGDYNDFYTVDGVIYCHLINPLSGFPINMPEENQLQSGIATVTLLGQNAAKNDALSTMLCVMGFEAALDYANRNFKDQPYVFVLFQQGRNTYEVVTNLRPDQYRMVDSHFVPRSTLDAQGKVTYTGDLFAQGEDSAMMP